MEEWKDVVGFEGKYEVSSEGRVRSLDRILWQKSSREMLHPRRMKGKYLALSKSAGYISVHLGLTKTAKVHCLVAGAFLGPCPPGMEVCHNDGSRDNNHVSNLRYGTRKENIIDASLHGKRKVTVAQVLEIRASPLSCIKLGLIYGVNASTIGRIKNGRAWSHVLN